nr:sigma-70 family RNA polymerase sigma factor [uncultured Agathobaculum sp.]
MTGNGPFEREADRAAYEGYLAALASDDSAFRASFRDAFFHALKEQLTDRQYEVLWLREVEGLSGKQIAYKLGISQSAVSRHLTRGKARLRVLLAYNLELRSQTFS